MGIVHLKHGDIRRENWLSAHAEQKAALYTHPEFLDAMVPGWEALVLEDELFMPLPVKRKFGIKYLVQPAFCQQIGSFGKGINKESVLTKMLDALYSGYPRVNIYLNQELGLVKHSKFMVLERSNYCLDLHENQSNLTYSTNHRRNLKKALASGLEVIQLDPLEAFEFYKLHTLEAKGIKVIKEKHKKQLQAFLKNASQIAFEAYGVQVDGSLVSTVVWASLYHRSYYFLSANSEEARNSGAAVLLVDHYLRKRPAETGLIDFEGSMLEGLARFYAGFGAQAFIYSHLRKA